MPPGHSHAERMSRGHRAIRDAAARIIEDSSPRDESLLAICRLLRREIPHVDWVGFYLVDPFSPRELVLGPFDGAATEHTRIPFGRGVCGQVAETHQTMVVDDVTAEENYLACSLEVRSEIVVPILSNGAFVAQLDIDSHTASAITGDDRALTESICTALSTLF